MARSKTLAASRGTTIDVMQTNDAHGHMQYEYDLNLDAYPDQRSNLVEDESYRDHRLDSIELCKSKFDIILV
jgi:hypothetical protein